MSDNEVLERRVTALEQEVEGEKLVTRHILEQTRRNGDDIAAMRTQLGRIEGRIDKVEVAMSSLKSEFSLLRSEFRSLKGELPGIIADTMRDVLRERDR
jgi:chromosome segregation ATPase